MTDLKLGDLIQKVRETNTQSLSAKARYEAALASLPALKEAWSNARVACLTAEAELWQELIGGARHD